MSKATKNLSREETKQLNLSLYELCLLLEVEGYALTPHRLGELLISNELPMPKNGREFGDEHVEKVKHAADKRRWWVPTCRYHDEARTASEKQQAHEITLTIKSALDHMADKPWPYVLNYLSSEPSIEIRRALRAYLNQKLRKEGVSHE